MKYKYSMSETCVTFYTDQKCLLRTQTSKHVEEMTAMELLNLGLIQDTSKARLRELKVDTEDRLEYFSDAVFLA